MEINKELFMKDSGETEEKKAWANKERKMGLNILVTGREGCEMEQEN